MHDLPICSAWQHASPHSRTFERSTQDGNHTAFTAGRKNAYFERRAQIYAGLEHELKFWRHSLLNSSVAIYERHDCGRRPFFRHRTANASSETLALLFKERSSFPW